MRDITIRAVIERAEIKTGREEKSTVSFKDIDEFLDNILEGPEQRYILDWVLNNFKQHGITYDSRLDETVSQKN